MTIKIYDLCGADQNFMFSPHCWKTKMSLAHKGLAWESVPTPFTSVATLEDGDSRRVPVIRDGNTVVEESYEIAKYLDEKHPDEPALLRGPGTQALTKFLIQWSQSQIHPAVAKLCLLDIYNSLAPVDQEFFRMTREKAFGCTLEEFSAKFEKTPDGLNAALIPLELTLKNQAFLGGDEPMFADYVVFGPLQWLRQCTTSPGLLPTDNNVAKWFDTLLDMYDGLGRKAPTQV